MLRQRWPTASLIPVISFWAMVLMGHVSRLGLGTRGALFAASRLPSPCPFRYAPYRCDK